MFFFIIICLSILLFTVYVHFNKRRVDRKIAEREAVYENLVKSVRFGHATDNEIIKTIPPRDYPYFQRFLQETISTIKDIDVSAEKKIAEVSGFIDYLKKRIENAKKWDKVIAVRVLSYFRDRENIPLFKKIREEETVIQVLYAATMGLALCKGSGSFQFRTVGYRLWEMFKYNPEAMMTILNIYGEAIAPDVHDILRHDELIDEGKRVFTKFLSEVQYKEAVPTIVKMLQVENSQQVQMSCLNALGYLGDESVIGNVLPFLEHEDFTMRIEALHAVAEAGGIAYVKYIESRLDDENWWVRREAALALVEMGKAGISHLKAIAEGNTDAPRVAAKGILSELQFNRIAARDI
jgi:HEAT repeat protein